MCPYSLAGANCRLSMNATLSVLPCIVKIIQRRCCSSPASDPTVLRAGHLFRLPLSSAGFSRGDLAITDELELCAAASRSGAPGYAPAARDLYEAMQDTLAILRTRYDVVTTRIGFMGASLGALEGAYLSVIEAQERRIGIDTYRLLNPPLDLMWCPPSCGKSNRAFFRLMKCTTSRPPWQAATGGTRHGQDYQGSSASVGA